MEVGEETVAWLGAMVLTTGPAEDDTGEFIGGTGDRGGQGGDGRGGEMLQLDMVCALVCYGARWMHRCEDAGDGCGDEKDGNARGVAQKPEMRDTQRDGRQQRERTERNTVLAALAVPTPPAAVTPRSSLCLSRHDRTRRKRPGINRELRGPSDAPLTSGVEVLEMCISGSTCVSNGSPRIALPRLLLG